jgi:predicted ester cyclase
MQSIIPFTFETINAGSMSKQQENKEFILRYFNALSGKTKDPVTCDQFMTDPELKEHILFLDTIFPDYEIYADQMTAEGDRVTVLARLKGIHKGKFNGIPPTFKEVEMPFAINYTIQNDKITSHWLIADQVTLMQQLGVMESDVNIDN